jgi:hypothetical protein
MIERSATDAIARFQHANVATRLPQGPRRNQPRKTCADDGHIDYPSGGRRCCRLGLLRQWRTSIDAGNTCKRGGERQGFEESAAGNVIRGLIGWTHIQILHDVAMRA